MTFYKKLAVTLFTTLLLLCGANFDINQSAFAGTETTKVQKPVQNANVPYYVNNVIFVKSQQLVSNPQRFVGKNIKMNATFDKFSTLGLDYNRALRKSSDYIAFLIQRDDVADHNIPLSELKLFLKRDYAEKFIDLETGDRIEIQGRVFSDALGDPWVDVNKITILKKAKTDKNVNSK